MALGSSDPFLENLRYSTRERAEKAYVSKQLHDFKAALRREKESVGRPSAAEEGRGQASQNDQVVERTTQKTKSVQDGVGEQNEKLDWPLVQETRLDEDRGGETKEAGYSCERACHQVPRGGGHATDENGRSFSNGKVRNGTHQASPKHTGYPERCVP